MALGCVLTSLIMDPTLQSMMPLSFSEQWCKEASESLLWAQQVPRGTNQDGAVRELTDTLESAHPM